eukprot:362143-Chlamydomonas_euryale.AAC.3
MPLYSTAHAPASGSNISSCGTPSHSVPQTAGGAALQLGPAASTSAAAPLVATPTKFARGCGQSVQVLGCRHAVCSAHLLPPTGGEPLEKRGGSARSVAR